MIAGLRRGATSSATRRLACEAPKRVWAAYRYSESAAEHVCGNGGDAYEANWWMGKREVRAAFKRRAFARWKNLGPAAGDQCRCKRLSAESVALSSTSPQPLDASASERSAAPPNPSKPHLFPISFPPSLSRLLCFFTIVAANNLVHTARETSDS